MTESVFVKYDVNINNIAASFYRMGWHAAYTSHMWWFWWVTGSWQWPWVQTSTGFEYFTRVQNFLLEMCHSCLQHCYPTIFTINHSKPCAVISSRFMKYYLNCYAVNCTADNHALEHTPPPGCYGKLIILLPVARIPIHMDPCMHHESHGEFISKIEELTLHTNVELVVTLACGVKTFGIKWCIFNTLQKTSFILNKTSYLS